MVVNNMPILVLSHPHVSIVKNIKTRDGHDIDEVTSWNFSHNIDLNIAKKAKTIKFCNEALYTNVHYDYANWATKYQLQLPYHHSPFLFFS